MKIKLFFIFLICFPLHSVILGEGLFRHSNNALYEGEITELSFILKENVQFVQGDQTKSNSFEHFVKIYFDNKNKLIQMKYSDRTFATKNLVNLKYIDNVSAAVIRDNVQARGLLFSVLHMYSQNSSEVIRSYLKKVEPSFKFTNQLINYPKWELLKKYKSYVSISEGSRAGSENPLEPSDPNRKAKVKELMAQPLYYNDENVSLVRVEDDFFFKVEYDRFNAYFNNNHELAQIEIKQNANSLVLDAKKYLLFNGRHQIPKYIEMKTGENTSLSIEFVSLRNFSTNKSSLAQTYADLKKDFREKDSGIITQHLY